MFAARFPLAVFVSIFVATVALPADKEAKVEKHSVSARVVHAVGEGVGDVLASWFSHCSFRRGGFQRFCNSLPFLIRLSEAL